MKYSVPTNRLPLLGITLAASLLGVVASAHGQGAFNWQGSTGANPNDPTNAANYVGGTVPTFGANNPGAVSTRRTALRR